MNIKRAIIFSFFTFVSVFVIDRLFTWSLDLSNYSGIFPLVDVVMSLSTVFLSGLFTLIYFRLPSIRKKIKDGLIMGVLIMATFFMVDMVIILRIYWGASINWSILSSYYTTLTFFITVVLTLVMTTTVGWFKEKEEKN